MKMKMRMKKKKKNECDIYQGSIEDMKDLKLPGEVESKNEKSQMYLGNNLNKIKNNFSGIYDKYQRLFKYVSDEEENSIDYEILSSKVAYINFYGKHRTLHEYLNHLLGSGVAKKIIFGRSFKRV